MSFNNIGHYTLGPHSTTNLSLSWPNGQDMGAIYISPDPITLGSTLNMSSQGKTRENDGKVTYWVVVNNGEDHAVDFSLQGGSFA